MITNMQIKQFSTSWGMGQDNVVEQDFQIMQAQGQTFFSACGDGDAYVNNNIFYPADDTNITSVGGTQLTLTATGNSYMSEAVWNTGLDAPAWCCNGQNSNTAYWGSGGGVNTAYSIPPWQKTVDMTAVGGSSTLRNMPDVAAVANNVWLYYDDGLSNSFMGTSIASPLWAGFTALVNQQAANDGLPTVGFINPALYSIGQSINYADCFHDITNGNNTWPGSPNLYYAKPGYDLCTGWGTPNGQNMIDALVGYAGPIWVNFSDACPGNGTYTNAFCTLALGTNAVATGGTICIVGPNSTTATATIHKAMILRAFYGPVTIGQ
jgi:subtilase family serine protease